jgi:hypothetical protein
MERITSFQPAFDKRNSDPAKSYGIGAMVCTMLLKGDAGAVQFVFSTGVYLPHVASELDRSGLSLGPMGYDVGYHSPKPMYDGQEPMHEQCEYTGGVCYYDGSGLQAGKWLNVLIAEGSEKIWSMLEQRYHELFDN